MVKMGERVLTNQQLFDEVYTNITNQGEPSVNSVGNCMYRGPEGRMCAAGPYIDNEDVEEDVTVDAIEKLNVSCKIDLLIDLQYVHDCAAVQLGDFFTGEEFISRFKEGMTKVAEEYNLTFNGETND